ncbi:Pentatricopeptide repeat [Dillenia turbinata]|uniref:Pentatricopeptide repeat n=1 Tax=Dillenia turbinata TaxID=194707 RepID=A0AAN8UWE0_9MAGN
MITAFVLSTNITVNTASQTHHKHKHKPKSLNSTATTFSLDLKSLSKSGKLDEALRLIETSSSEFHQSNLNSEVYADLLHTCITRKSLEHGQRLYLQLLLHKRNKNLLRNPIIKSKLITLYSVCGRVEEARQIFNDGIESKHVNESVWVAMAIGYSKNGYPKEALLLYCQMLSRSALPGNFAFSMAIKACSDLSDLRMGKAIHAQIVKSNNESDQVVDNALLGLYAHCGSLDEVFMLFEKMPQRNIVSWNSLISSFVSEDQLFESLELFRRMQLEKMGFTWVTFTTILSVCSRITAFRSGKEIHAQIVKSATKPDVLVLNSIMDMYAKCGEMELCRKVFDAMQTRDLTSWNTILTGYAVNGSISEAMELLDEMIESGFEADGVTFIALLSGCSHTGLIEDGQKLFHRMENDFGLSPTVEHYACLVDLLGRAGRIEDALEVVKNMPMEPSGSIWGSLLNSCKLHGNVSLADFVAVRLFEVEPNNPGNYVMLSNIYADAGMWEAVKTVRERMEKRGIKKEAGCSWIQVKDRIHTFVASGGFEFQNSKEYKKVWNKLMDAMEDAGYVPNPEVVLHNVDEEVKAMWVCGHSERLATMYGLIKSGSGMPVRVMKNLRVCVDCHSWMKFVSKVTKRLIVLRDTSRFHHFENGICSCKDYW